MGSDDLCCLRLQLEDSREIMMKYVNLIKGYKRHHQNAAVTMISLASDNLCLKGSERKHWLDKSCSGNDNALELFFLTDILRPAKSMARFAQKVVILYSSGRRI